ncbi:F-box/FBD/LRR-repeat protein At1g13570-like isoform X2 [Tasmannia lanceolata]|uniref:F-box/FBD/LRR-repeat protein At1g13570-like isoform X2 n=1 Tax=Tasmannia lanceolata TaxID=3420 RepID=UPI0040630BFF
MGETRAYSRHHHAKEDRISKLSDDILGSIFSLLPMKEAARSSILSKRFRFLFTSRSHLVLNHQLLPAATTSLLSTRFKHLLTSLGRLVLHRQRNRLGESWSGRKLKPHEIQKWVGIVNHIISLRRHHDSIQCCEIEDICLDECPFDMDRFLSFLTKKGIQRFILKNSIESGLYKVPLTVFYCRSLRELELQNCSLNSVPTFACLHRLESLKLMYVEASEDLLTNLVSSCTLLKELELFCPDIRNLEIEIPNLLKLVIFTKQSSIIRLKNAARLVNFSLQNSLSNRNITEEDKAFHLFLRDVANVKCLQLSYHMGYLCRQKVPENLSYHFPNLTILNMVIDLNNANDARFFTVLLDGAPFLQNITLGCDSPICDDLEEMVERDYWKKLKPFYCMRHHLVTVRIDARFNSKYNLGILEFLLMNGSVLKEMRIAYDKHYDRGIKNKKKSLLQLRASSQTLVIFTCEEEYY